MDSIQLEIVQGTPFRYLVKVKHRDEFGELVPMPIGGSDIQLQARINITDDDPVLDLSTDAGGIIFGGAGEFILKMTSEETSALNWRTPNREITAVFQCELTPAAGETLRVLSGRVILNPRVVR